MGETGWPNFPEGRLYKVGDIVDGEMILNEYGLIIKTIWNDLPNHYNHIKLDEYVCRTIFMALSL